MALEDPAWLDAVYRVDKYIEENPDCSWSDIWANVRTHYKTLESLVQRCHLAGVSFGISPKNARASVANRYLEYYGRKEGAANDGE